MNLFFYENEPFEEESQSDICITQHARLRFAERTRFTEVELEDFVEEAFFYGRDATCFEGKYKEFLLEKASGGLFPLAYRGLLLLFDLKNRSLVTVYALPDWFFSELPHAIPLKESLFDRIFHFLKRRILS